MKGTERGQLLDSHDSSLHRICLYTKEGGKTQGALVSEVVGAGFVVHLYPTLYLRMTGSDVHSEKRRMQHG
jgi:hypothetical protein